MSYFWRLKHKDNFQVAIDLKKNIPELKNVSVEHLENNLNDTSLEFYALEKEVKPFWLRMTLPLAFLIWLILFVFLPINYIIIGRWGYRWEWIKNWFSALGF